MLFRFHQEVKPIYTLQAKGCEPLELPENEIRNAKLKQVWIVKAPEECEESGVILSELVCVEKGKFALIQQLRNPDGTEIVTPPEYFYYEAGKLFQHGLFGHIDELEENKKYQHTEGSALWH